LGRILLKHDIMTLHEAIVQVLISANRMLTTQHIADQLNKTKAYQKRDGSSISDYQIHGRTRKYPLLFDRYGNFVSLKGKLKLSQKAVIKPAIKVMTTPVINENIEISKLEKILMKEPYFKSAKSIDLAVPSKPGMYCIKIKNIDALPKPFSSELKKRGHSIIYIGIATKSLFKRMLNQELRANGHGTFFRSIGAVLDCKPPIGLLANKKNKRNYKFSETDKAKIINWINENLQVNWVVQKAGLDKIETALILKYKPLLNIAKNPAAMSELTRLRRVCVDVANGNIKF